MKSDDVYKEFLVECAGFGDPPWDEELDEMLPLWTEAAKKLGLTQKDMKFATKEWIPRNFEVGLEGERKTIGLMVAEATDMMRAKEYKEKGQKLVYGVLPAQSPFYMALKKTNPEVNVYFPDVTIVALLSPFFHKIAPFLEYAEEQGVRYGCRHCALNKTRYAALRTGLIPIPDVSWIWGFVCDQAPNSDEFIQEYWNIEYPIVFSRIAHHGSAGEVEYKNDELVKYMGEIMRHGYENVCEKVEAEVDEKAIMEALKDRINFVIRYGELLKLMAEDPAPLRGNLPLTILVPTFCAWNTGYKYANNALTALIKDAKERVKKGEGVVPKGSPKAMAWFIPNNNPFVARMFDESGVALTYCEGLLPSKAEFEMPRFTDPFEAQAEAFLKMSLLVNWRTKADLAIEKLETYDIDCMIWGFLDFDRWLGSDHKLCSRYVEEKTGKPCFYIEGDIYEDRDYSEEALRTRIETICEVVKARMTPVPKSLERGYGNVANKS